MNANIKPRNVAIRESGNSRVVVIPKPILAEVGLGSVAAIVVEANALVLRKPTEPVRASWAEAARQIALQNDDVLVLGEFGNEGDAYL